MPSNLNIKCYSCFVYSLVLRMKEYEREKRLLVRLQKKRLIEGGGELMKE